jgi:hypothetical protein
VFVRLRPEASSNAERNGAVPAARIRPFGVAHTTIPDGAGVDPEPSGGCMKGAVVIWTVYLACYEEDGYGRSPRARRPSRPQALRRPKEPPSLDFHGRDFGP